MDSAHVSIFQLTWVICNDIACKVVILKGKYVWIDHVIDPRSRFGSEFQWQCRRLALRRTRSSFFMKHPPNPPDIPCTTSALSRGRWQIFRPRTRTISRSSRFSKISVSRHTYPPICPRIHTPIEASIGAQNPPTSPSTYPLTQVTKTRMKGRL